MWLHCRPDAGSSARAWRCGGLRARVFARSSAPAGAGDTAGDTATSDTAARLSLLTRSLELAVRDEAYGDAARLKKERTALVASLAPAEAELQAALGELRHAASPAARAAGARRLAALPGITWRAAELVAPSLHDPDAVVHAACEAALWALWERSGDEETDGRYRRALSVLHAGASLGADTLRQALVLFEELHDANPGFPEALNKVATLRYHARDYAAALRDCEAVVKAVPSHFGALAGGGSCALRLGDMPAAIRWFTRAVAVNPRLETARAFVARLSAELEGGEGEGGTDLML